MSGINSKESDFVRYYLISEITGRVKLEIEPKGWRDDALELTRSMEHGMFNQFSNSLLFYDEDKDLIENVFKTLGQNGSLFLLKTELLDNGEDVVWTDIYMGRADWETKEINNGVLSIKFNSKELEEKIEAHESDDFSIETTTSVDDEDIGIMEKYLTDIEGRELFSSGKSILQPASVNLNHPLRNADILGNELSGVFFKSEITAHGPVRFSSIDTSWYKKYPYPTEPELYTYGLEASHMFFTDVVAEENSMEVNVRIDTEASAYYTQGFDFPVVHLCRLLKVKRTWSDILDANYYAIIDQWEIWETPLTRNIPRTSSGQIEVDTLLEFDEGLLIWHQMYYTFGGERGDALGSLYDTASTQGGYTPVKQDINVFIKTFYEPSIDLSCIFIHDAFARLTKIITGKDNLFYSKWAGRTELGYDVDGEAGLIALMSGYWIRAFDPESERYKSPIFSWRKLLESCNSCFNVGLGFETINGLRRARVEEVEYFYQNEVVIDLGQVSNLRSKYDKDLYFSGIEIGYNKGGDYENAFGLDEPNILSQFVTPDRKSTNKYRKVSDIRADETGLELARRKPEIDYPDEDTNSDEHNWFLDLKRGVGKFQQRFWSDRLQEIPTGINSPDTFRSFFFTPLTMLRRHGWILRSGIETYLNRKIKFISSNANSKLAMFFIGDSGYLQEDLPDGLLVNRLDRSRFLPERVTMNRPYSKELNDKIYGKTRVFYRGSWEDIPNYYFKFRWTNEEQEVETGYLMEYKPTDLAEFEMQRANNKRI